MKQSTDKTQYLRSGKQTELTTAIKELSSQFQSQSLQLVFDILGWIGENIKFESSLQGAVGRYLWGRTALEVLTSRFATGCTDYTLAFIALARAKQVPTVYIETLSKAWLDKFPIDPKELITGHSYAKVSLDKKVYFVDSTRLCVHLKLPAGEVVFGEGVDTWDLGLSNKNWKKKFLRFKVERQKEAGS
ncbi:transglutaminase-like domain-containing protein [Patescibacteria group bacterium]|nr:transglutaminase-like domain-containing protein [Patescibacteria group bacterium]